MSLFDVIEANRTSKSRKERLVLARRKCCELVLFYILGPQPSGDAASDAHDMESSFFQEAQHDLKRGMFPEGEVFAEFVVDGDYVCEDCGSTGHLPHCNALNVEDLGDCLSKCEGCCPHECPEWGMNRVDTHAKHRMEDLLSGH